MPNELLAVFRVRAAVRRRTFAHVAHNLWVPVEQATADPADRVRMLMTAVPAGSAISHETAVWWYGLPLHRDHDLDRLHITVPPGNWLERREFVVHTAKLRIDDLTVRRAVQLTTPERTLLDLARTGDRDRLVVVGDAMLAAGLSTVEAMTDRLGFARGVKGVRLAREIVPLLSGLAQSPPESIIRLRFHDAGLPTPVPQCPVDLGAFTVHTDLGWPEAQVGVEYEGRQHAEQGQFLRDIDRYSALSAAGWLIVRAGSRDLPDGSRLLISRTRAALRSRGVIC